MEQMYCAAYACWLQPAHCASRRTVAASGWDRGGFLSCADCGDWQTARRRVLDVSNLSGPVKPAPAGEAEKMETVKKDEKTGCRHCGNGQLLAQGLCKSCYTAWRQGKLPELGEYRRIRPVVPRNRKKQPAGENVIAIDFSEHLTVLGRIRKAADEEIRTLEQQAMYLIKKGLEAVGR
jgi:hypothetical protein